jgi:hypothetical protein
MSAYAESAERFAADVRGHKLTVLHEDGLYRHLRFQKPGTHFYWFDLITWPGCLAINGDMEGYTFSRVEDMFTFFRASSGWNSKTINPQYWAEKLRAASRVKQYSEGEAAPARLRDRHLPRGGLPGAAHRREAAGTGQRGPALRGDRSAGARRVRTWSPARAR